MDPLVPLSWTLVTDTVLEDGALTSSSPDFITPVLTGNHYHLYFTSDWIMSPKGVC